ncbi:SusD/RagB family nutrient-binding outer membrane lipoprotein [Parabacteroides sp.]|uniref:SusD/RagB family nutrient-binding outer membrane lipoprotein n=1 Tax=Parabacteroides sp. TaxID=1869337 RepID=UPI0026DED2C2|nr:SusD/RagB family nutrient-binding outer membrane lipoprotein [Parabacteroides sp.]MDO5427903.1 SusD/RagB family nutrient-binding outer membrane lipoprotein [Parabacteroides sp.]
MRTIYKKLLSVVCILGSFGTWTACTSSFDDLNTNPDTTSKVTPSMLATKMILGHVSSAYSVDSELMCKRLFLGERISYYQYNWVEKGSFDAIRDLTNAQKMVELASEADKEAYTGLYYYLKGWAFYQTTINMGDIPYSEALLIETFRYPKYDEQKEVFLGILNDLEQAEIHFSKASSFNGDPFYNGDPEKWKKATNVLRLKVLMTLQKRSEDTADLQVKEKFAQIVNEGNLFRGNEDNLQVVYSNKEGQKNPLHHDNMKWVDWYAGSSTLIDPLKKFKDYRLFSYFSPMQTLTDPTYLPEGETLLEKNDWGAYQGIDVSCPFNDGQKLVVNKRACSLNEIYRSDYAGVPSIRLGYADMNFILAEAAERGWINRSAQEYYKKGIRASFEFVRSTVSSAYNNGMDITDEYIDQYLGGEGVAYKTNGSSRERLEQIWLQAYLASFFHLAWDSYYDYRRTGSPALPINPETNMNDKKNKIPVRWLYPESETNYNKEQLQIALKRQWGGSEDVNKLMWILK